MSTAPGNEPLALPDQRRHPRRAAVETLAFNSARQSQRKPIHRASRTSLVPSLRGVCKRRILVIHSFSLTDFFNLWRTIEISKDKPSDARLSRVASHHATERCVGTTAGILVDLQSSIGPYSRYYTPDAVPAVQIVPDENGMR